MIHHPNITLRYDTHGQTVATSEDGIEFLTFAGGEPHVKVNLDRLFPGRDIIVEARCRDAVDVWFTILLGDLLGNAGRKPHLVMPYFPGARQDRYTSQGSPFTAKIMAQALAIVPWESITVWEPHSKAALDEIQGVPKWRHQVQVGPTLFPDYWPEGKYSAVVTPDKGAFERTYAVAKQLGNIPVIIMHKDRDPSTGELSGFKYLSTTGRDAIPEGTYLLFDDICDGGGTFNGVADVLSEQYRERYGRAADIDLYVVHGIFSKGTEELFKHFTTIYSTTSWRTSEELKELDVIPVPLYPGEPVPPWER